MLSRRPRGRPRGSDIPVERARHTAALESHCLGNTTGQTARRLEVSVRTVQLWRVLALSYPENTALRRRSYLIANRAFARRTEATKAER